MVRYKVPYGKILSQIHVWIQSYSNPKTLHLFLEIAVPPFIVSEQRNLPRLSSGFNEIKLTECQNRPSFSSIALAPPVLLLWRVPHHPWPYCLSSSTALSVLHPIKCPILCEGILECEPYSILGVCEGILTSHLGDDSHNWLKVAQLVRVRATIQTRAALPHPLFLCCPGWRCIDSKSQRGSSHTDPVIPLSEQSVNWGPKEK